GCPTLVAQRQGGSEPPADQTELSSRSSALPPSPAAGGFDANAFAAPQARAALAGHEFGGTIGAKYFGASRRSVLAARQAVRSRLASVGEQGHRGIGQHFHFSDDAVAAAMFSFPAAARAQRILHHP